MDYFRNNLSEVVDNQFALMKINEIMNEVSTLTTFPKRYPLLSDLYEVSFDYPYRRLLFEPYIIVYLVKETTVNIIRIFHEKEDYLSLLEE